MRIEDAGDSNDPAAVRAVLAAEYALLAAMLGAVWSASLVRTSLFLGVLSAIGVGLGFAAQAGGGFGPTFTVFALVGLPLALFLGLATFARTVELQRESLVYITGMNRIRHFMAETVPGTKAYFVLSVHDDELGVYRSQGTGIRFHAPRYRLVFALVQTQGIVAVMCAAIAGVIGGLALAAFSLVASWIVAGTLFLVTLVGLLAYWQRSVEQLRIRIHPMFPTTDGTDEEVV
ncbi:MAG: hypothetical protein ACJ77C_13945 [Chloroflexota bacterium]